MTWKPPQDEVVDSGWKPPEDEAISAPQESNYTEVSPLVQKTADEFNVPARVGRGVGVAIGKTSEATGLSPLNMLPSSPVTPDQIQELIHAAKNPEDTLKKIAEAAHRGYEAMKPGFKPTKDEESYANTGEIAGNTAALVPAAAAIAPLGVAGQLAADTALAGGSTALTQAQKGKVKVLPSASDEVKAIEEFAAKPGIKTALNILPDSIVGNASIPGVSKAISKTAQAAQDVLASSNAAQDAGMDAIGMTKRYLNTPQKLAKGRETAQILLDKGVISATANPEEMIQRASDLSDQSGQAIGDYLKSIETRGRFFKPDEAIKEIESLRPKFQGGLYKKIQDKIDTAVETIKAHGDEPISFEEANKLKGMFQEAANFNSNKDATMLDKVIAGKVRESIDKALENVSSTPKNQEAYKQFLENKKVYGAAQNAVDPLYNRLSSELGNKKISLTDWILAAPTLATGNPLEAIALLGGKRVLQRFGPQTKAVALNSVAQSNIPKNLDLRNVFNELLAKR